MKTLQALTREVEMLKEEIRRRPTGLRLHDFDVGYTSFNETADWQSHTTGQELEVHATPFYLPGHMSLRRMQTWFTTESEIGTAAALALYKITNWQTSARGGKPGTADQSNTPPRPPLQLQLLRAFPPRDLAGPDPTVYIADMTADLELPPGGYAVGYQFSTTDGRWIWTNPLKRAGFRCAPTPSAAGEFPATLTQIRASYSFGPWVWLRSAIGIRLKPSWEELLL